ncbi:response regulator transcription factor [Streptomyces griseoviridis]|uniref:DNA-binding response regulator n=3 Tax=Streptomyces TaxID=1883 RepID=A0A918GVE9_STRGD|nr:MULTISPECIES: response regulator transcription factor [Streptomyces]MDP9685043.1 DNA-binding NarL/FixJ family response regulator [Streptomyces griseoviridis]GGS69394.1 DNA-binding response regulator [Streptomyces niveoruber]GGT25299.1 DNA-binding response regulator [Streptomyces griseoviridis]GGU66890.1 DNA-binding response regulator [Streptomyces daghestanicus]GHI33441.1 DNA-binding response regulator [Streptomyces daghestanicus]
MSQPLRAVLGEDQPIVREGIETILRRAGVDVVAAVGNAVDLVRAAGTHRPDVVITDIRMPPGLEDDGLRAAQEIRTARPETAVIVLSQFLDASYALDLVGDDPSGVGYLLKEKVASPQTLTDAVERVVARGSALDPDVISALLGRKRPTDPLAALTPKERAVLALMAEGHSNTGIADRLYVSVAAVERHVTGIFMKLELSQAASDRHRRVTAVLRYLGQ